MRENIISLGLILCDGIKNDSLGGPIRLEGVGTALKKASRARFELCFDLPKKLFAHLANEESNSNQLL